MADPNKPHVIVVGADFSETGELALQKALELALHYPRSEVHVLNVMHLNLPALAPELESVVGSAVPSITESAERLRSYVEKRVAAYRATRADDRAFEGLRIVSHLRTDSPAFELAQLASDLDADMVVVGTHGRRALARMILGSVAEVTVRLAPCPVLVVRPKVRAVDVPQIEPPCPRCVETRKATGGQSFWCEQHSERHGQRHTYHQGDRTSAGSNFPLVVRS